MRGSILMPVLFVIIAFSILMVGGKMVNVSFVNPNERFTPNGTDGETRKLRLQLKTINLSKKPPETFDCGDDAFIGGRELYILWAIDPPPGTPVGREGAIKAFYEDEWPLTLGEGDITPAKNSQDHAVNPSVGDDSARDDNGFPYFPALFISDITNDPNNRDGDAQNGGTPHKPSEVFGAWQAFADTSHGGLSGNNIDLGPNADTFPSESNVKFNGVPSFIHGSFGAEIIWNVEDLGLENGHTYRAQFILHDGDSGADISQGCTTIQY